MGLSREWKDSFSNQERSFIEGKSGGGSRDTSTRTAGWRVRSLFKQIPLRSLSPVLRTKGSFGFL